VTPELTLKRVIRASATRLFDAWTQPDQLVAWWGPPPVTCSGAEVDLRVGGRYRIANAMPDGKTFVIEGVFEAIEPQRALVYTWRAGADQASRVTVAFEPRGDTTEVAIVHESIPTETMRRAHEAGWGGCLDELERWIASDPG